MGFLGNIFNQNDNEKEMSGGAMFGYALIAFIVVVIIVFIIFTATKLIGNSKKSDNNKVSTQVEKQIEVDTTND